MNRSVRKVTRLTDVCLYGSLALPALGLIVLAILGRPYWLPLLMLVTAGVTLYADRRFRSRRRNAQTPGKEGGGGFSCVDGIALASFGLPAAYAAGSGEWLFLAVILALTAFGYLDMRYFRARRWP